MQGYFKARNNDVVVFDAFYRENPCGGGYAIACGLEQVIDYIKNLQFSADDIRYLQSLNMFDEDFLKYLSTFRFSGSIYAIPEGTVMFPREPFIKVIAPIMEAQLVETAILNILNHRHKSSPCLLCSTKRRCHGIRPAPCTGTGFRYLRCPRCCHRRLLRNFQRTCRTDFQHSGQRHTRPQLDHEFSGRVHRIQNICGAISECLHSAGRYL